MTLKERLTVPFISAKWQVSAVWKARLQSTLFVGLIFLQLLDWHSTVAAGPGQYESNRLIRSISTFCSFPCTVGLVKGADLIAVYTAFWAWRRSTCLDFVFTVALACLVPVYAAVVINNYIGR